MTEASRAILLHRGQRFANQASAQLNPRGR
jgi:hypothetical protein